MNRPMESRRRLAVAFSGACAFLGLYATQPLLPTLERLFNVSKSAVGMTVTACTLGVALAAPMIGTLADRFGRKRVIVASATLLALATLLNATATSLPALVFWRFLQGIFTPGVFAVTVAYVQDEWDEGGAGAAMAAYVTGTVIGGFLGRLTSGLIGGRFGWHAVFLVLGALGACGAWALQAWLPKERHFAAPVGDSLVSSLSMHLHNRRLLVTFAAGFCVLFSLLATFTYVTFHLAAPPFHLGPTALGLLFFVYLVGAVITPPCGRGLDRFGHRRTFAAAIAASAAGVLLTLTPWLGAVIAGLALGCSGVFVAQAAANSYIGRATEQERALAVGLYVTFYYVGGSFGAVLPGLLWGLGGWPVCVLLIVLVQIITILLAWFGWRGSSEPERVDSLPLHS